MTVADNYAPTRQHVRAVWLDAYPDEFRGQGGAKFDRWLAAHDAALRAEWEAEVADLRLEAGKRADIIALLREDEAELARIRADGKRQFTAAYRAQNGNVIALDTPTVVQEHAAKTVAEFSEEAPEGPTYFVATRILPPWVPVNENGSER